jgi:3-deoxy-D-manno-octulosonic-acid transferase
VQLLYELTFSLAALFLLPYGFAKGVSQGVAWRGTLERFAHYPRRVKERLRGRTLILIHAVSVGEVIAATPLVRQLKKEHPEMLVVMSTMTFTGRQIAAQLTELDLLVFFPLDLSWVMRRFLRRLNPALILIVETELWPNFLRQIQRRNIPLFLVNGRISKRSFSRYRRVRFLIQPLLRAFSCLCMQDNICARRIRALGADAERICVTGNVKFDGAINPTAACASTQLKALIRCSEFVWVGGSTHSGEDEILLACHQQLLRAGIPSFLVLAPRHPQRFDQVADLMSQQALPFVRRSAAEKTRTKKKYTVLLLDSMGELDQVYPLADVVFVGGSLVPVGGHNLLEPARAGKAVLHGPYMENFPQISHLMNRAGAAFQVEDRHELQEKLELLFSNMLLRRQMGQNGQLMVERNSGATRKTLACIEPFLRSKNAVL